MGFEESKEQIRCLKQTLTDMAEGMEKEDAAFAVQTIAQTITRDRERPDMGFCSFLSPRNLPSDLRVDYVYVPTYYACAIIMRAVLDQEELLQDESIRDALFDALNGSTGCSFFGHGYDAVDGFLQAMEIFAHGRVLRFVERYPTFNETFTAAINKAMAYLKQALCSGKEKDQWSGKSYEEKANRVLDMLLRETSGSVELFVYGTLMRGQPANPILEDFSYLGRYYLKDYGMLHLGAYPGVAAYRGESTVGEVYSIPAGLLPALDRYECEGSLYTRKIVTVANDKGRIPVYVYVYNTPDGHGLQRTMWNAVPEDEIWYACYGSNLSAKRFSCYIEGGTCEENGRTYPGCTDKTRWTDEAVMSFPGELYFGNTSGSWENRGVAFFDPEAEGVTFMRLYRIKLSQLYDLRRMEGASAQWYGRILCLGVRDNLPVYTLTSETRRPANAPCDSYLKLIAAAMKDELKLSDDVMPDFQQYLTSD